ncbi:MAG: acetate--CoA ligase family protein, partial [Candidatus Adiutrix sp.]|nr:acetate--CoA ligase family protein [Candidatus Adiutrix sp.]
ALAPALKNAPIPVLTAFWGSTLCGEAGRILRDNGIPASEYPEQAAIMLHHLRHSPRSRAGTAPGPDGPTRRRARDLMARVEPGQYLQADQAYELLKIFGVRSARGRLVKSAGEARSVPLEYPVAAKIDRPDIAHKASVGGVKLNLADPFELGEAVEDLLRTFSGASGVLVQEQVPAGLELIISSVTDPQLGSGLMVGLGGVWVEIIKDVVFGYPPLDRAAALELIDRLKCAPLLNGYRSRPGVNKEALAIMIERISAMLPALPEIAELDLNPVIYDRAQDAFIAAGVRIKKGGSIQ